MTQIFPIVVSALYSVAYTVKMAYKRLRKAVLTILPLYPFEGVWQKIEGDELVKRKSAVHSHDTSAGLY